jgi:hypothetical protein
VITFGSGIKDLRGNPMEASYILAFSTGDSLDQASITGFLEGMQETAAAWIWAYPLAQFNSPDPRNDKAPFAVQPQGDGEFALIYLPAGDYRIFGIEDVRRDRLWQPETEALAFPPRDIDAQRDNPPRVILKLCDYDLTPPKLMGGQAIHRQGIRLSFDEPVDVSRAKVTAFKETDVGAMELPIISVYQNPADSAAALMTTAIQREGDSYSLLLNGIGDRGGNFSDSLSITMAATAGEDTIGPRLSWSEPADGNRQVSPTTALRLGFTEALTLTDLPRACQLVDSGGLVVEGTWSFPYPALVAFSPSTAWQGGGTYVLTCWGDSLRDIFGNPSPDSLISIRFRILDPEETGSASGRVAGAAEDLNIVMDSIGREAYRAQVAASENGSFRFERLIAGEYRLWAYQDRDQNGQFSSGRPDPYTFAEAFWAGPDTVRIRARWETEDLILDWNPGDLTK